MQSQVTDFQVWQDFMPAVPRSGPPLHALFTLTINEGGRYTQANTSGSITITRANGEVIARAPVSLNQQADDLGMAQPGPQSLTFMMASTQISTKLVEKEALTGEVSLTLAQRPLLVKLPQIEVMFTH